MTTSHRASDSDPAGDGLRFDNRVAIVTGAGRGIGRAHARLLASRGASVLVNDFDPTATSTASAGSAAHTVAAEIASAGGRAIANCESVTSGAHIVQAALDGFGRIDILINNAGFLRDRTFHKMTKEEWGAVLDVHLQGAFAVTREAWPLMRGQRYGRVVFTTSGAALWGNFGQANYCAAKAGVIGLMRALAQEGSDYGIHVNCLAPSAASRLAETVVSGENLQVMSPDLVSPAVAYLVHERTQVTGRIFEVGVGYVGEVKLHRASGANFGVLGHTPETIREAWRKITDFAHPVAPESAEEVLEPFNRNLPEAHHPLEAATIQRSLRRTQL
jgi:3-hydroxyacyl-CoA dehydrogenase/3a,7a,12a-trihydroxy-5b-cholest-24-enoyl-CoA hydratase